MQLSNIKQFLEVYRKNLEGEDEKRAHILRIFKEETGVTINEKSLVIKKGVLHMSVSPIIKNEIFLHREKIIIRLKEEKTLGVYDIA